MGVRFQGFGPNRATVRRERMMFYGGGSVAFALIVVGALLVYSNSTVQAREDLTAVPAVDADSSFGTVVLIAPTTRVPKGTKLTKSYLREIHWPRDQVPEGALRHIEDVEGMFSNGSMQANQPILRSSIAVSPPSFGIGELLPPGHRAVTIRVDAISGVEGWARAGAHVDVFLTYVDQREGQTKTRIAVEDAIVLSYGGNPNKQRDRDGMQSHQEIATTVTLAVPLEDSLKIQTASAMGQITLALRNSNDIDSTGNAEFAADDWDEPVNANSQPSVAKGFARYTDSTGNEKQFILDNADRWFHSDDGDDG